MTDSYDSFVFVIKEHLKLRPAMQVRDVYKLLFQGVRGPEHLIRSRQAFKDTLEQEWEALDAIGIDPSREPIRPDGSLQRLNLRPYKAAGERLDLVVDICLETARRSWGTQEDLEQAWSGFFLATRGGEFPTLALDAVEELDTWLIANNFPPVHHSEIYAYLYRPAYRLIATVLLSQLSAHPA